MQLARTIANAPWFSRTIIGLILLTAVLVGLETSDDLMARYGQWLLLANQFVLVAFIVEKAETTTVYKPSFLRLYRKFQGYGN